MDPPLGLLLENVRLSTIDRQYREHSLPTTGS